MKILNVTDMDFDCHNDWLVHPAADQFEAGNYTHICDGRCIVKCEVMGVRGDGLVAVGEQVYVHEDS